MTTYLKCDDVDGGVRRIVDAMVDTYHQELRDAGVSFALLFAHAETDENDDAIGPALKLHGYPCAATVRIVPYKQRVLGVADAEIVIDGDRWDEWSEEEKAALIDHELTHLELKVDGNNVVVRDDLERPKLKMRNHDHQFGWFDSVARRHGRASFEVQQADAFVSESYRQLWLPYMDSEPEAVDTAHGNDTVPIHSPAPARKQRKSTSRKAAAASR